jgi:hypothetical protein
MPTGVPPSFTAMTVTPEQKCPSARRKVRSLVAGVDSDRLSVSMIGSLSTLWTVMHTLSGKGRHVKGYDPPIQALRWRAADAAVLVG